MDRRVTARMEVATGRERELGVLVRAHEEARSSGTPGFVLVHGPQGIGKSHLLAAARRAFAADGVAVVEARPRRSTPDALGLIRELVPRLLDVAQARGLHSAQLAELTGRLAPLVGDGSDADRGRRPEEIRLDAADAVASLLLGILGGTPVVLLDDLDAADRSSLELIQYLSAVLLAPANRQGVLVVLAWRDGSIPPTLQTLLERLPATHLPLSPLDLDGIRSFLGRPEVAERLLEATAGDPSRLEAVLSSRAPVDLTGRRLARLEPEAQHLLLAAAVLARPTPAPLLREVAGAAAAQHLERMVGEGFLSLTLQGSVPAFGLARESDATALLASAPAERLASLHGAAALAVEAAGAGVEEIARHHLAADPVRGADWALRAAESLAGRCAFDAAIELYHAALAGPAATHRAVHRRLAAAYEASGDMLAAVRHVGLSRRGATAGELREARSEAARLCVRIGKLPQAERLCRLVLDGAEGLDPADGAKARAWVDLCEIRYLRGDYEGAIASAERGIAAAGQLHELRIGMRNTVGRAQVTRAAYAAALEAFATNATEAESLGLRRELMRARINQGAVHHRQGDREQAIAFYRRGLELGEDRALVALALHNLAALYHEIGEVQLALEHYGSALAAFTLLRRTEGIAHAGINHARLLLFLGDHAGAAVAAEHARREAEGLGNPNLLQQAVLVLGETRLSQGDSVAAAEALAPAWEGLCKAGSLRYAVEAGLSLARALLGAGGRSEARRLVAEVESRAAALDSADLAVEVALAAAEVELGLGAPEAALDRLDRAKELLVSRPKGIGGDSDLEGPWRLYALLGQARAALGDGEGAAAHRLRARALLDELASRIPAPSRERFLAVPLRARLLAAATEPEIGPGRSAAVRNSVDAGGMAGPVIVGRAPALQQVLRMVEPVGRSLVPVLLRGESGTGKERIAEAIHRASPRAHMPLVRVNCAAMHEELLLSELFGHEKGAFTGAVRERKGRFELADGGTIFLDEVGELSPKAQVALLRVLQEKSFERLGGTRTLRVDARVICATNRNLEEMIAAGRFRDDLYYRLKGVMLELPPLRDRKGDIPALAQHFLSRVCEERGLEPRRFTPEVLELLASWSWPGNVRELENVVSAVSIFAEGAVVGLQAFEVHGEFLRALRGSKAVVPSADLSHQPDGEVDFYALAQAKGMGVKELRHELELQMISRALLEGRGNISEAARLLQMKRSRLSQIVNAEPRLRALARGAA